MSALRWLCFKDLESKIGDVNNADTVSSSELSSMINYADLVAVNTVDPGEPIGGKYPTFTSCPDYLQCCCFYFSVHATMMHPLELHLHPTLPIWIIFDLVSDASLVHQQRCIEKESTPVQNVARFQVRMSPIASLRTRNPSRWCTRWETISSDFH